MDRNYEEFDYIRLYIKNDIYDEYIKYYFCFGWELHEIKESSTFLETKDVVLKRKHKIKNKDTLQLMQVYAENDYSKLSKAQKHKYDGSVILGLTIGILCTLLICAMIKLAIWSPYLVGTIFASIVAGLVGLVLIYLIVCLSKIKKIEDSRFEKFKDDLIKDIQEICLSAEKLWKD